MVSRLCTARACACWKLTTRLGLGLALKSLTMIRIAAIALLKSRLASASAGRILDGLEGGADIAFAGDVSEPVGEEADHGDQRQHDDTGAHRYRSQQPGRLVERKQ